MTYLITVIIPIHNGKNVIENNLKSLLNQTINFENIEVILIDDCSTDSSLNLIKKYSQKYNNIKTIHLTENYGSPGNPRNIGINESSSKYIMFLDQDDYYLNDMCEKLYEKIKEEKVDFISCLYYLKSEKNLENKKTVSNPLEKYGLELKIHNITEIPLLFEVFNPHAIMVWNKIYKKSFLIKNNIKFPKKCLSEDLYFTLQCFINGEFMLLNNYFGYVYVLDDSSTSHTPSKNILYKLLCGYNMIFQYLKNKNYKVPKLISNQMVYWTFLFLENKLSFETQKDLLKMAKPFYENFNLNYKIINNSSFLISLQNFFIKIFSSQIYLSIIFVKIYQLFKINKIYKKIYYFHLRNIE